VIFTDLKAPRIAAGSFQPSAAPQAKQLLSPVTSNKLQYFATILNKQNSKREIMPSNANTAEPAKDPATIQPKDRSISQSVKAAGFKDLIAMMQSYGLKRHVEEDFEEAKAILDAMNQQEQLAWQDSQTKV
jgi:hypothetical protein